MLPEMTKLTILGAITGKTLIRIARFVCLTADHTYVKYHHLGS